MIMHSHSYFILSLLTSLFPCNNIFCMLTVTAKQIDTFVQQPHLCLWINRDDTGSSVLIGGQNGWTIINPLFNKPFQKQEWIPAQNNQIFDVAINNKRTQYAVSLSEEIKCYKTKDLTDIWQWKHGSDTYVPIVFDSQNSKRVIYTINSSTGSLQLVPHEVPQLSQLLYSDFTTDTPLCCHPEKTEVATAMRNDVYTIQNEGSDILSPPRTKDDLILQVHYLNDNTHILIIRKTYIQKMQYIPPKIVYPLHQPTESPYVASEMYDDTIIALLTENNMISFYNYVEDKSLATISLQLLTQEKIMRFGKRLSFSPDKKYLLVALQNNCFVIPISLLLYIKYGWGMEKLTTILCVLRPFYTPYQ